MNLDHRKAAGYLLFVSGVQCLLVMLIAEAVYPGYSVSSNWISDLGVGSTSLLFNSSVFLLGAMLIAAAWLINLAFDSKLFSVVLAAAGVGAMGVGLFPETAGVVHTVFSLIIFLFGGLSAILSYRLLEPPFSYFSVLLGATTLLALILTGSGTYLGLGKGGMERMVAHPALLWEVGFGGYLIGRS